MLQNTYVYMRRICSACEMMGWTSVAVCFQVLSKGRPQLSVLTQIKLYCLQNITARAPKLGPWLNIRQNKIEYRKLHKVVVNVCQTERSIHVRFLKEYDFVLFLKKYGSQTVLILYRMKGMSFYLCTCTISKFTCWLTKHELQPCWFVVCQPVLSFIRMHHSLKSCYVCIYACSFSEWCLWFVFVLCEKAKH